MTLNFEVKEPKATWLFINKDTGHLEMPSDNGLPPRILQGVEGRLIGLSVRVQQYDNPNYEDTKKILLVFSSSDGEKFIIQTGLETYISKWFLYLVLNDRFDLQRKISFFTAKKEGIPVVVGRIYQDNMLKDIDPEVRKTFPKIEAKKQTKIDWAAVFGSDNMELVVAHADNHLQGLNQLVDFHVETVTIESEPSHDLEPENDSSNKEERLLDMPF